MRVRTIIASIAVASLASCTTPLGSVPVRSSEQTTVSSVDLRKDVPRPQAPKQWAGRRLSEYLGPIEVEEIIFLSDEAVSAPTQIQQLTVQRVVNGSSRITIMPKPKRLGMGTDAIVRSKDGKYYRFHLSGSSSCVTTTNGTV